MPTMDDFYALGGPPHNDFKDRIPPTPLVDSCMRNIKRNLVNVTGLKHVMLGYVLLNKVLIFRDFEKYQWETLGHTSLLCFPEQWVKKIANDAGNMYLCYVAVPLNEDDDLLENPAIDYWQFDSLIQKLTHSQVATAGAFSHGGFDRWRTFKFLLSE